MTTVGARIRRGVVSVFALVATAVTVEAQNNALQFGGTNAYVSLGNTSALGLPTFTIETWFMRQGTGATTSSGTGGVTAVPLVTKGRGEADGSNLDMNYFLGIRTTDNVLVADFEDAATGLNHPVAGGTPITNNIWHHAAATYDGSTWRLYLDGNLDATLAVGAFTPRSDSIQYAGLATAMTSTGAAAGFFNGVLDEVRIWSVARTQLQIQQDINLEIASAAGLVARWGLNEGSGTSVADSSGTPQNGSIMGSNWSWVAGAPFNIVVNLPPDQPGLNSPADGATDVTTSPTLSVSVSDPDGDPLTVTFYGRAVVPPGPDFTIAALPDTQHYVDNASPGPAIFQSQTDWIVDNRVTENIVFVPQLGDCVEHGDNGGDPIEWIRADAALSLLENPLTTMLPDGIPFGVAVGNHDQSPAGDADGTTTFYNQYFGEARFLGRSYYGGHYGSNNDEHYELFSASGMDFIIIMLEYDTTPDAPVLAWAEALLQAYPNRRAIVVTHHMINTGNPGSFSTQGQAIYDALKDNPNLFLLLGGHVLGEGRRQDVFEGRTVHSLLADYQGRTNGGDGWLRLLKFSPTNDTISVKTYSPWLNQFETDADSQFTLAYDMGGSTFTLIATVPGVPSGGDAETPWSGRLPATTYEWYVSVSDGDNTTTGPVWSFTTAAAGCGDGVIGGGEECDDGDAAGGDGCSATCTVEDCYACVDQPSVCTPDNGAPCNDGLFCNGTDTCSGGSCGHAGNPCAGGTECADTCNEATDSCFDSAGTPCTDDGNVCTDNACNGAGSCAATNNAASCNDGLFCNGTDTCSGGSCAHSGDPCVGGTECNDACNETADNCADAAGTGCASDGNECTNDECDGAGACGHPNNTAPCDDGLACTTVDGCAAGSCVGSVPAECDDANPCTQDSCDDGSGCINAEEPALTCLTAAGSGFQIKDSMDDTKDRLRWKWQSGEQTLQVDFGDPLTATGYALCVYDTAGGVASVATWLQVDANGLWQSYDPKGWRLKDPVGTFDGVQQIKLKPGAAGRSKAQLKARGVNMSTPVPFQVSRFFAQDPKVTVQLVNSEGICWTSEFTSSDRNTGDQFKAKRP